MSIALAKKIKNRKSRSSPCFSCNFSDSAVRHVIRTKSFQGHDGSFQYCECGGSDRHIRTADRVGYLLARLAAE
jgi:hypothetical protein